MSTRYVPTKDNHRHKKLKWLNFITHAHDIFCDCDEPLAHTIGEIITQEPNIKFNIQERDLLKKCLGEDTTTVDALDVIGEGDLEDLFKEDIGEDDEG
jgi:hypothetical protein